MPYQVVMPSVGPKLERFQILRWELEPNSEIKFGDVLCSMAVLAEHRANRLSWLKQRKLNKSGVATVHSERAELQVLAREPGVLASIEIDAGAIVAVGDCIAICTIAEGGDGTFSTVAELIREHT